MDYWLARYLFIIINLDFKWQTKSLFLKELRELLLVLHQPCHQLHRVLLQWSVLQPMVLLQWVPHHQVRQPMVLHQWALHHQVLQLTVLHQWVLLHQVPQHTVLHQALQHTVNQCMVLHHHSHSTVHHNHNTVHLNHNTDHHQQARPNKSSDNNKLRPLLSWLKTSSEKRNTAVQFLASFAS